MRHHSVFALLLYDIMAFVKLFDIEKRVRSKFAQCRKN